MPSSSLLLLLLLLLGGTTARGQAPISNVYTKAAIDAKVNSLTLANATLSSRINSLSVGAGIADGVPIAITNVQHGQTITHNLGTIRNLPTGTQFTVVFVPAGTPTPPPDPYVTFTVTSLNALVISTPLDGSGQRERATGTIYITPFPPTN